MSELDALVDPDILAPDDMPLINLESGDENTVPRERKLTEKGKEEFIMKIKKKRTTLLSSSSKLRTKMTELMADEENLHIVKSNLEELDELFKQFTSHHNTLVEHTTSIEDKDKEYQYLESKQSAALEFRNQVLQWIQLTESKLTEKADSLQYPKSSKASLISGHSRRTSIHSSVSRSRERERIKLAEMLAEKSMLKRKQELQAAKEELELETNIAKSQAREKVYAMIEKEELESKDEISIHSSSLIMKSTPKDIQRRGQIDNVLKENISSNHDVTEHNNDTTQGQNKDTVIIQTSNCPKGEQDIPKADEGMIETKRQGTLQEQSTSHGQPLTKQTETRLQDDKETCSTTVLRQTNEDHHRSIEPTQVTPNKPNEALGSGAITSNQRNEAPSSGATKEEKVYHRSDIEMTAASCDTKSKTTTPNEADKQSTEQMKTTYCMNESITGSPMLTSTGLSEQSLNILITTQLEQQKQMLTSQRGIAAAMKLPQARVPIFKGDVVEYKAFVMAFDSRIKPNTSSDADRLYYLHQHVTGEPKDLIEGCLHVDPEEGYKEARHLLDKEYGDPYKISVAYTNQLMKWPSVKHDDATGLKRLSLFLVKCKNAMKTISYMEVLNHAPHLQAIVQKLPTYLQNKWREEVLNIQTKQKRSAGFSDIVKFVEHAAEVSNDPIFGKEALSKVDEKPKSVKFVDDSQKKRTSSLKVRAGSLATSTSTSSTAVSHEAGSPPKQSQTIKCLLCQKYHDLESCKDFVAKSLEDKKKFLTEKSLCFACFGSGHRSKGCTNKRVCQICNKPHPTALHIENFTSKETKSTAKQGNTQDSTKVSSTCTDVSRNTKPTKNNVILQAVLPVKVVANSGQEVLTYALYDNGSTGSFITEQLKEELNVEGIETVLQLGTMHGKSSITSFIVNDLIVTDIRSENAIALPRCYTRHEIPVSQCQIPTPEKVAGLQNLREISKEIPSLMPDIEVGLLIGSNCPLALEPLEIRPSGGEGPFAMRLSHGWTLNGPLQVDFEHDDCCNSNLMQSVTSNATSVIQQESNATDVIIRRFSDWYQLKKAVAVFLRYKGYLQHRLKKRKSTAPNERESLVTGPITVEEVQEAGVSIVRYVQSQAYAKEIHVLNQNHADDKVQPRQKQRMSKTCLKRTSSIHRLDPFLEEGVLKVGGRLCKADLSDEVIHPVILPKENHVTTLIIEDVHRSLGHAGRGHVLSKLRERYWVVSANATVRQVISKCVTCRRLRGKPPEQKMADLPRERVTPAPPFTFTGVDYFGPYIIKNGRKEVKRWGALFTCLASRAVHIEIANSLDTDSFLQALRRFIARRGVVKSIRSDNGTNFVGAQSELRQAIEEMNQDQIRDKLRKQEIEWSFNPPAASNMGGIWERQIRTTRKVLAGLLSEHGVRLDDESLHTLMCEVEAIINSRPLTFVSSDHDDLEPLTPNHLLTTKSSIVLPPPGDFQKGDIYLRRRWRRVQYLANVFWSRWQREYLTTLQQRCKWQQPDRNLVIGDVVLIKEDNVARNMWSMGIVVATEPDSKGLVRAVTVKTKTSSLRRPSNKLVLLLSEEES